MINSNYSDRYKGAFRTRNPICVFLSGLKAAALRRLTSEMPRCRSVCKTEYPRLPESTGAFSVTTFQTRDCILCGYPIKVKGVTAKVTPFDWFAVLRVPPEPGDLAR